jgi:hypothetical protein
VIRDASAVCLTAARLWLNLLRHPVLDAVASSESLFEVPFSFRSPDDPSTVMRGVIDCLVRAPSGAVTVVEFKTGVRDAADDVQLSVYVAAARALFPGSAVEGVLVYAGG